MAGLPQTTQLSCSTLTSGNANSVHSTTQRPPASHFENSTIDRSNVAGSAVPHQHIAYHTSFLANEDESPHIPNVTSDHDLNALQSVQPESIWSNDPWDPSYPFASLASYPHNGVTIARDTSITSPQLSDVVAGRPISDSELANGNAVVADSDVQRSCER